mgnify:CR=1 FL=1
MLKKKRKQCPYKPSSVFLLKIRMSVIYLVPKSPLGSSTLPSTVVRRLRTSRPQTAVYMSLQLPDGTAWRSPASWWSLTPPSHPYHTRGVAVVFFYRHLPSPTASTFGSGVPCAARTFLSHLKDASDRPEHCFRHAKVQKTFDTIARFLTFLCIISYSQGYFHSFPPVKPSFRASVF